MMLRGSDVGGECGRTPAGDAHTDRGWHMRQRRRSLPASTQCFLGKQPRLTRPAPLARPPAPPAPPPTPPTGPEVSFLPLQLFCPDTSFPRRLLSLMRPFFPWRLTFQRTKSQKASSRRIKGCSRESDGEGLWQFDKLRDYAAWSRLIRLSELSCL